MTNWIARVNIYDIINRDDDGTPEGVLETAKMIHEEVRKDTWASVRLSGPTNTLVNKTKQAVDAGMDYESVCDVFNGALSRVYDVADEHRIWTAG